MCLLQPVVGGVQVAGEGFTGEEREELGQRYVFRHLFRVIIFNN